MAGCFVAGFVAADDLFAAAGFAFSERRGGGCAADCFFVGSAGFPGLVGEGFAVFDRPGGGEAKSPLADFFCGSLGCDGREVDCFCAAGAGVFSGGDCGAVAGDVGGGGGDLATGGDGVVGVGAAGFGDRGGDGWLGALGAGALATPGGGGEDNPLPPEGTVELGGCEIV